MTKLVIIISLLLGSAGIVMAASDRDAYLQKAFNEYGQYVAQSHRPSIWAGKVQLGMSPYEAKLAANSAFNYMVKADTKKWPKNTNPLTVIDHQSIEPDDSEIWMNFRNKTQFDGQTEMSFRVYFERGRAVKIEKLSHH